MEACFSANYLASELIKLRHKVKLITPQYVKPLVKVNKNDYNDAEDISEAAQRPTMRLVPNSQGKDTGLNIKPWPDLLDYLLDHYNTNIRHPVRV